MVIESDENNYLLFSLMKKSFVYTYICLLFSNRIFWNYLRKNSNLIKNDFEYLNNESQDLNNQELVNKEINYISLESIKKFKEVTNPEEYTISNLKRAISNESLKDIFNYHQSLVKKNTESNNNLETSIKE